MLLSRERVKFSPARRKVEIATGIAKAMSRTHFGLTTMPVEISAVRSKNEFLEVPLNLINYQPSLWASYPYGKERPAAHPRYKDCIQDCPPRHNALQQAMDIRAGDYPPEHPLFAGTRTEYADTLTRLGRYEEAESLLLQSQAALREHPGRGQRRAARALQRLRQETASRDQ